MWSFMDHIPPARHATLREAIDAVTETKMLLDQVAETLGSHDPEVLAGRLGERRGDVTITEQVVGDVRALRENHEQRRTVCRELMAAIASGDHAAAHPSEPEEQSE